LWFTGERLLELSREEFSPRPRVRSTFLALTPKPSPLAVDPAVLRRGGRPALAPPRTQPRGAPRRAVPPPPPGRAEWHIDPRRRGETLDEAEFAALANALAAAG